MKQSIVEKSFVRESSDHSQLVVVAATKATVTRSISNVHPFISLVSVELLASLCFLVCSCFVVAQHSTMNKYGMRFKPK